MVFAECFLVEFIGFHEITGVPFIGDGEWDDVEVGKGLWCRGVGPKGEHFDDGGGCGVYAVFAAAVFLGYPDGVVLVDDKVMDVAGEVLEAAVEGHGVAAAFHLDEFVAEIEVAHEGCLHEVVPKDDIRCFSQARNEDHLEEESVECDVAMV